MANRACKVITTSSSPVNIGVSTAAAGAPTKARSAMAKGLGEERLTSAMNTGFPRATLVRSAICCALAIRSAAAAALASISRALVSSNEANGNGEVFSAVDWASVALGSFVGYGSIVGVEAPQDMRVFTPLFNYYLRCKIGLWHRRYILRLSTRFASAWVV
jgi:hypothetical protein